MSKFHYLVRGICILDDAVLVVRAKGADNTFLPGGHIEFGEKAEDALRREIMEEIGMNAKVGQFVGAVEHVWPSPSLDNHEINLLFEVKIENIKAATAPVSMESHLELHWVNKAELAGVNLRPAPLIQIIQDESYRSCNWASTLDGNA